METLLARGPLIKRSLHETPDHLDQKSHGPLVRRFLKKPDNLPIIINTIFMNNHLGSMDNGLDLGLQGLRNKLEENLRSKESLSEQPKGRERFWQNLSSGFKKTRQSLVIGAVAFSALAYVMLGAPPPDVQGDATPIVQTSTPTASTENKTMTVSTPNLAYGPSLIVEVPSVPAPAAAIQPPQDKPEIKTEVSTPPKQIEKPVEEETIKIPPGSNPWQEAHLMFLQKRGYQPSNTQIMNATIAFVKENDIEVKEWKIKGSISDRELSPTQTFKATGMIKRILQD